jgi:3-oxoacyl-[acyl-carrier-protein] synthase-3
MPAYLHAIRSHVPEGRLTNEELSRRNPTWSSKKIVQVTGIEERRIAAVGETAGDLAVQACQRLFRETKVDASTIDALLFCTQSPDYFPSVPATACTLQDRLGLPQSCGAFDYSLGCSGFTYGLWLARALVLSGSAKKCLLVMSETVAKNCAPDDMATTVNFGDGAAACLVSDEPEGAWAELGDSVVGTDGKGAPNLIVRGGGARAPDEPSVLTMNGAEVFSFTLHTVHLAIEKLLEKTKTPRERIDWYLFHQANRFLVESLGKKMAIPRERLPIDIADIGNTSSASIPILIERCQRKGLLVPEQLAVLCGFGVGYSWGATLARFLPGVAVRSAS